MAVARADEMFLQISDFFASAPSLDEIINFKFPADLDERLQYLMDQNNSGEITPSERQELEKIVDWAQFVSITRVKAKLRKAGKR